MLNKIGTPNKLQILKQSAFEVDLNVLASVISDKYPEKKLSINDLHEILKTLGVTDYKAEDMQELVGRLHAVGITVTENV
jgi:hypothetical protein